MTRSVRPPAGLGWFALLLAGFLDGVAWLVSWPVYAGAHSAAALRRWSAALRRWSVA